MTKSLVTAATLWALLAAPAFALDTKKLQPTGYVNDFAHVLDARSAQAIEAYLGNVDRATGAQITVVTVDSIEDEPVEDVANRLYREWGVGKKGKDEGMLVLLAIRERRFRAEVGYGLEPIITDGQAGTIMRGVQPILRQGNYGGALFAAVQQFGTQIAQAKGVTVDGAEPLPRVQREPQRRGIPFPLIVLGIIFFVFLMSRGNRGGGFGPGGGGSGVLPGLIIGSMLGGRRGGWGDGGFGGGGGGGGGFGGFGGGDSGGGGASGGW